MFTNRQMIRAAFRRNRVLDAHRNLSEADASRGLEVLGRMWTGLLGMGALGRMHDKYLDDSFESYTAGEYERITATDPAIVITLPNTLQDECTGKTRTPFDGALISTAIIGSNDDPQVYCYDALAAKWWELTNLDINVRTPFYERYGDSISALLAVALADEYGQKIMPFLASEASRARMRIGTKSDETRPSVPHEFY